MKLEEALEVQQVQLERTLQDLRRYKRQHDTWSGLLAKIVDEQASMDTRMSVRMGYEQFKIQSSLNGRGQECVQYQTMGQTYISCNLRHDNDKHKHLLDNNSQMDQEQLEELLRTFEYRVGVIGGGKDANDTGDADSDSRETSTTSNGEDEDHEDPSQPSKQPMYAVWPEEMTTSMHMRPNWPTEYDCSSQLGKPPQWNEYPTVFLSPENKGFE
jgi:hypothetical protein